MTTAELVVKQSELAELLNALGFPGAEKWTSARLQGKLKGLIDLEKKDPDAFDDLTDAQNTMVDDLIEAANNRIAVEIEMDLKKLKKKTATATEKKTATPAKKKRPAKKSPEASDKKAPKKKKAAAEAPKKKAAAKASDNGSAVERDRFGSKTGTQCAVINAALTKKPQSPSDIAREVDLSVSRVSGHLKYLKDRGHVEKVEGKGWKTV